VSVAKIIPFALMPEFPRLGDSFAFQVLHSEVNLNGETRFENSKQTTTTT
jgi:hypothetical protein